MTDPASTRIHPTALLSSKVALAPDVTVGAFAILEGEIHLGAGCVIGPRAHLIGPLTMGRHNEVYSNAVIGEKPQHLDYRDEPTSVEVGESNVFRENVTIHRGTSASGRTVIGTGNYFMAGSHVGHDCRVGDHCTLANNALLGGHCILANGSHVGGNSAVHQNCRLGRLCVLEDTSSATVDIPPFIVQHGRNIVFGVNAVGMRHAGISEEQILAMQRGYDIVYSQGNVLNSALARLESELGAVEAIREFVTFARQSRRGIGRIRDKAAEPGP